MLRFAVFIGAVALASLSALAGDLRRRDASVETPAPFVDETPINWGGLYIGGHVGYGLTGLGQESGDFDTFVGLRTFTGGGHAGFDIQFGRVVVGPYAQIDFTDVEEVSFSWDAGGRAGILVNDRALVYAVLAYSQLVPEDDDGEDEIDSVDGLKYGLGVEVALTENIFMNLLVTQTDYDVEGLPDDIDATDNRAQLGFNIKLGSALPALPGLK